MKHGFCSSRPIRAGILCAFAITFTLATVRAQIPGWALRFDGVDDHVVVSSNASLTLSNQLTFEAWVFVEESKCNTILSRGDGGGNSDYIFQVGYNGSSCTARTIGFWGAGAWDFSGSSVPLYAWTHVAVTYDGSNKRFYINGVLDRTVAGSGNLYPSGSPLFIGRQGTACNCNFFKGRIDELRIWNTVRTSNEISQNMSASLTGAETGLAAYYRFDEGAGPTTADATGHGNAGTLTNGTSWFATDTPPLFTSVNTGLRGVWPASVDWGDYDNDGRLDVLISGNAGLFTGGYLTEVWRNTGSGFVNINAGLPAVGGCAVWGDYDNDGLLDILFVGRNSNSGVLSQIWRNTGSGFVNINAGLTGVEGSCAWGDYDNDGRLDALIAGRNGGFGSTTEIWRNTPGGFVNIGGAGLPALYQESAVAWGDYDNDGRVDVVLAGFGLGAFAGVWHNTPGGFVNINAGMPALGQGSVAWGDYDNDGRLDVLLTGFTTGNALIAQVWRNTGNGFSNINAGLTGVYRSSARWGDYDNDGRLDILLAGQTASSSPIVQVWRNTGAGFVDIVADLPGLSSASVAWGDYNNDGRLDILVAGMDETFAGTNQLWRNETPTANSPPQPPSGLSVALSDPTTILFSWDPASDLETPAAGLSYNLRVGTTPGASDIVGPMSSATGARRMARLGNASVRLNAKLASGVSAYYWSVQTVDTAFAGSTFAAEKSFKLLPVPVPISATSIMPGDLNGDGIVSRSELDSVLSNYFPNSPWLYMTNTAGLGGNQVTFSLSNSTAGAFSVEYTTNLSNWLLLGPAIPRYEFNDTNAPANPRRYYRLRYP